MRERNLVTATCRLRELVLVAVDDSEGSVRAAETAHRLFGDDAEYLAVNVTNVVDLAAIPWYGAGWGAPYAAPYGAVWAYRSDLVADPGQAIADSEDAVVEWLSDKNFGVVALH